MRTREFLSRLEHDRIVAAIQAAEAETSAEIRVYIQRGKLQGDALIPAQRQFHKLSMHKTSHRAGVLIYVAPRARKFAIVGDRAIHEHCGEALWQDLAEKMSAHFRAERFTDAIADAVGDIGGVLTRHFPRQSGDRNELSDDPVSQ
jgi:uncharacterized membrane protein